MDVRERVAVQLADTELSGLEGARIVASYIRNPNLTFLDLSNNNIDAGGTRIIVESLKTSKGLSALIFQGNSIGSDGAKSLADMLQSNTSLTCLNLKMNSIGFEGVKALADCLKVNETLTSLDIGENICGFEGWNLIAQSLKVNTSLLVLDIQGLLRDSPRADGVKALAECLKVNTSLTDLRIPRNNIAQDGAKYLADSLKVNRTLLSLDCSENCFKTEGVKFIADSLSQNTTLCSINLWGNGVSPEGLRLLTDCLSTNHVITSFGVGSKTIEELLLRNLDLSTSTRDLHGLTQLTQNCKQTFCNALWQCIRDGNLDSLSIVLTEVQKHCIQLLSVNVSSPGTKQPNHHSCAMTAYSPLFDSAVESASVLHYAAQFRDVTISNEMIRMLLCRHAVNIASLQRRDIAELAHTISSRGNPLTVLLLVRECARCRNWEAIAGICAAHATHNQFVDMSFLKLKEVPSVVGHLRCSALDLSGNFLQSLPSALSMLPYVILKQNPLSTIPERYRTQPWDKLKDFITFNDVTSPWMQRKLLLVGEGAAGKTTLLRCIMGQLKKADVRVNVATDGIAVHPQFLMKKKSKWSWIAWDLGGQDVLYPTHQFFLCSNSIFLLLFDLSVAIRQETGVLDQRSRKKIQYWVKQVHASQRSNKFEGQKPPSIMLVGTHLDMVQDQCMVVRCLEVLCRQHRAGTLFAIFALSAKTGDGFQLEQPKTRGGEFEVSHCPRGEAMSSIADTLEDVCAETAVLVPERWVALLQEIQKVRQPTISWRAFAEMASPYGVIREPNDESDKQLRMCADFFADSGILIHFRTATFMSKADFIPQKLPEGVQENAAVAQEPLANLVVLQPSWLSSVMSRLISISGSGKWIVDGILLSSNLCQLFKGFHEQHLALIELLQLFEIIYRIPDISGGEERILVPCLLPHTDPLKSKRGVIAFGSHLSRSNSMHDLSQTLPQAQPLSNNQPGTTNYRPNPATAAHHHGRVFEFNFVPVGLFARLMVRILGIPGVAPISLWRDGMIVSYLGNTQQGDLKFDEERSRLSVTVSIWSTDHDIPVAPPQQNSKNSVSTPHLRLQPMRGISTSSLVAPPNVPVPYSAPSLRPLTISCPVSFTPSAPRSSPPPSPPLKPSQPRSSTPILPSLFHTAPPTTSGPTIPHVVTPTMNSTTSVSMLPRQLLLVQIINTFFAMLTSCYPSLLTEMRQLIPCPHCLKTSQDMHHKDIYLFSMAECIGARNLEKFVLYCKSDINHTEQQGDRAISLSILAPDIALVHLPVLSREEIRLFGTQQGNGANTGESATSMQGGFGKVMKGEWKGHLVAVKQPLDPAYSVSATALQEFLYEANMMSMVPPHRNIVRFFGVCTHPEICLVMEFIMPMMPADLQTALGLSALKKPDLGYLITLLLDKVEGPELPREASTSNSTSNPVRSCSASSKTPSLLSLSSARPAVSSSPKLLALSSSTVAPAFSSTGAICSSLSTSVAPLLQNASPAPTSSSNTSSLPSTSKHAAELELQRETLEQLFPMELRRNILADIARGMYHLHSQVPPLLHRDLHAGNVFICSLDVHAPGPWAKVADFGLSEQLVSGGSMGARERADVFAPEVLTGARYGVKADVWSFGMLTRLIVDPLTSAFSSLLGDPMYSIVGSNSKPVLKDLSVRNGLIVGKVHPEPPLQAHTTGTRSWTCPHWAIEVMDSCWSLLPANRGSFTDILSLLQSTTEPAPTTSLDQELDPSELELIEEDLKNNPLPPVQPEKGASALESPNGAPNVITNLTTTEKDSTAEVTPQHNSTTDSGISLPENNKDAISCAEELQNSANNALGDPTSSIQTANSESNSPIATAIVDQKEDDVSGWSSFSLIQPFVSLNISTLVQQHQELQQQQIIPHTPSRQQPPQTPTRNNTAQTPLMSQSQPQPTPQTPVKVAPTPTKVPPTPQSAVQTQVITSALSTMCCSSSHIWCGFNNGTIAVVNIDCHKEPISTDKLLLHWKAHGWGPHFSAKVTSFLPLRVAEIDEDVITERERECCLLKSVMLSSSCSGEIHMWDGENCDPIAQVVGNKTSRSYSTPCGVTALALVSPDSTTTAGAGIVSIVSLGNSVAVCTNTNVRILDTRTYAQLHQLTHSILESGVVCASSVLCSSICASHSQPLSTLWVAAKKGALVWDSLNNLTTAIEVDSDATNATTSAIISSLVGVSSQSTRSSNSDFLHGMLLITGGELCLWDFALSANVKSQQLSEKNISFLSLSEIGIGAQSHSYMAWATQDGFIQHASISMPMCTVNTLVPKPFPVVFEKPLSSAFCSPLEEEYLFKLWGGKDKFWSKTISEMEGIMTCIGGGMKGISGSVKFCGHSVSDKDCCTVYLECTLPGNSTPTIYMAKISQNSSSQIHEISVFDKLPRHPRVIQPIHHFTSVLPPEWFDNQSLVSHQRHALQHDLFYITIVPKMEFTLLTLARPENIINLTHDTLSDILGDLCFALSFLTTNKLVHANISPMNILIVSYPGANGTAPQTWSAHLSDFSCAQFIGGVDYEFPWCCSPFWGPNIPVHFTPPEVRPSRNKTAFMQPLVCMEHSDKWAAASVLSSVTVFALESSQEKSLGSDNISIEDLPNPTKLSAFTVPSTTTLPGNTSTAPSSAVGATLTSPRFGNTLLQLLNQMLHPTPQQRPPISGTLAVSLHRHDECWL
ncbi:leucine-rich repeat protein [Pelomyxa schiedti]|nr:leucine-rich repeat protein [Pelomyxa schiedti]